MKIMFLGQQGWLLSEGDSHILVDPILTNYFGSSQTLKFLIYPPREKFDVLSLPDITAVIITNEHLDHFHLPSLKSLSRKVLIILGAYTPTFIIDKLTNEGFKVKRCSNGEIVKVGCFLVRLFIGSSETPFWERRVYHPYIENISNPAQRLLIQSDTIINKNFIKAIKKGDINSPTIFIVTNNSQVTRKDKWSAFGNLYPLKSSKESENIGLSLLKVLLDEYCEGLPDVQYIFFSGGGYIIDQPDALPFKFSDIKELAKIANQLCNGQKILGLLPGEQVDIDISPPSTNHFPLVKIDRYLYAKFLGKTNAHEDSEPSALEAAIFGPYVIDEDIVEDRKLIEREHRFLAKMIVISELGKLLFTVNKFINGVLNHERFVINYLISDQKSISYVLDLNSLAFVEIVNDEALPLRYPFGISVFLKDFANLLKGKIQIWELATTNMRQWYVGNPLCSPVAFFYHYFSEQIRPDLGILVCENHETT